MTKDTGSINKAQEGQGELFPEFQASGRSRFAYLKKEMALGKKIVVSVSYENLVLFFIVLIMLIVVFFSLGVERGKRAAIKWAVTNTDKAGKRERVRPKADDAAFKPYTIQILVTKKIEDAQTEAARLSSMGYGAFIIQSRAGHHVCVGRYASAADTNEDLPALKARYPDCYPRKIANEQK